MNDWVYVTNRILERGGEVMLYDNFYKRPKKKNIFKEIAKASALVLYYAIRYLA